MTARTGRRGFLKSIGLGAGALLAGRLAPLVAAAPGTGARPNVILIMADDMGFSDIGCYGSEIQTPNLDALAAKGIRFTQFYNGARCCPTRAQLLTGLYAHQTGMGCMEPDWKLPGYRGNINRQCVTLAEALKPAGYRTYMAGKWHVTNTTRAKTLEEKHNWPRQRGFDRYFGTIAGAGSFFTPKTLTRDNDDITDEAQADKAFYYTDAINDATVGFIDDHAKAMRDTPFFAYVAHTAPHWPLHALAEDIKKYAARYKAGWDALRDERHARMKKLGVVDAKWPLSPRTGYVPAWAELEKLGIPKHIATVPGVTLENIKDYMALKMAIYAAMVDRMDQGIGRIVAALRKHGLLENTLILFLADNGGCSEWGVHGFGLKKGNTFEKLGGPESWASYGGGWANASNTPFRYYKHYAHEGGIATPLIVQWPKVVKDTGAWRSQVGHIIDIMPTLLDAAGGAYPKTHSGEAITPAEGVSLLDAFAGKAVERGAPLFWEHHGNRAVRDGKWKTVAAAEKSPWELYDMEADRTEVNDLAASQPAIVKALDAKWQAWAERCNVLPMCPNKKSAYIEARKKEREAREKERRARIEAEKAKKR